jgi:hypothetical protein
VQQQYINSRASVLRPKISTVAAVCLSRASVVSWLNSHLHPSLTAHAPDAAEEETLTCFLAPSLCLDAHVHLNLYLLKCIGIKLN